MRIRSARKVVSKFPHLCARRMPTSADRERFNRAHQVIALSNRRRGLTMRGYCAIYWPHGRPTCVYCGAPYSAEEFGGLRKCPAARREKP